MGRDNFGSKEIPVLMEGGGRIPLFLPHIPKLAVDYVSQVLSSRWIGQGPRVDEFENRFKSDFLGKHHPLAVGSGTDALHISYLLAGIKPGDEVAVPVFTCTATNLPLLYMGAKPKMIDVDPETLNINLSDLKKNLNKKTKAIVVVHYGGLPCEMDEISDLASNLGIPVIEDAAHALGAKYKQKSIGQISEFTMFSFQAIKHITTGDGGLVSIKNQEIVEKAKRLRWFGIDRSAKQLGIWENDIVEIGFKYQMNDIAAAIGLAGLGEFESTLQLRRDLLNRYVSNLHDHKALKIIGKPNDHSDHAAWLFTILAPDRRKLQEFLFAKGIESNQVHYRNDRYSIFGGRKRTLPNMDEIEDKYLVLPLHTKMSIQDVDRICESIEDFYSSVR